MYFVSTERKSGHFFLARTVCTVSAALSKAFSSVLCPLFISWWWLYCVRVAVMANQTSQAF